MGGSKYVVYTIDKCRIVELGESVQYIGALYIYHQAVATGKYRTVWIDRELVK